MSHIIVPEVKLVSLTQNSYTQILPANTNRKSLYIDNRSTSEAYLWFGTNPWCVDYDGTDDHVTMDGLAADTEYLKSLSGSITARLKMTASTGVKTIFALADSNANEYMAFYFDAAEKLSATLRKAAAVQWTLVCSAISAAATWYNVRLIHNGSIPIIYIDGVKPTQALSVTTAPTMWLSGLSGIDNARIGDNLFSSSEQDFYLGQISTVAVCSGVETNGQDKETIARYAFDEGTGTSAADATNHGHTGTLVGTPSWVGKDAAQHRLGTGWNWPKEDGVPCQAIWGYTTAAGVTVAVTEGI